MKRITLWLLSIAFMTACTSELVDSGDGFDIVIPPVKGDSLSLVFKDAGEVGVGTYSTATVSECYIDNLWVVELNAGGTAVVNDTMLTASAIFNNGKATQLLPQLPFTPTVGNRLLLIANSDQTTTVGGHHPSRSSITYSNINTHFKLEDNGYYFGGEHLPMYGEILNWNNQWVVDMTRAVAKIQVRMGTSVADETGNFTAESVSYTVVDGAKGGRIQPVTPLAGTPQPDPWEETQERYMLLQKSGATEKQMSMYLYEYPNATQISTGGAAISNKTFHANRAHILLAKSLSPGDSTFYRLDFYDRVDSQFIDIKRNHHYLFTINRVGSEGYRTSAQAHLNPGSNIEYSIIETDPQWNTIISNGQYAIAITAIRDTIWIKNSDLTGTDTDENIVFFKWINGSSATITTTVNSITLVPGSIQGTGSPTFTINSPTTNPFPATAGVIDWLNISRNVDFDECILEFKFGNITHRCVVKKKPL